MEFYSINNSSLNSCIAISDFIEHDLTLSIYVRVSFAIVYSIIFLFGLVGNGGVVVAVLRIGHLRTAQNLLLLNLMVADIMLCLTAVPVTPFSVINKEWTLGYIMCRLIPLCQSSSVVITSWALAAISNPFSIDKYVHITGPTRPPIRLHTAFIVTGLIWVMAVSANIPYVLSYKLISGSVYQMEGMPLGFCGSFCDEAWVSSTQKVIYGWVILALQFIIPLMVIAFCYCNILIKVRKDLIIHNTQFAESLTLKQRSAQVEVRRKVTYVLIAMVCTFVISWLPLSLVNILRDLDMLPLEMQAQPYLVVLFVHSTAMTTVLWNPMLFFWLTRMRPKPSTLLKGRPTITQTKRMI